jgi:small GTP-binding protein
METIKDNIKLLLVGDSYVGKTSIVNSYITNKYDETINSTIGLDYNSKIVHNMNLQLYDTSGNDRFKTVIKSYYKYANIIMFVFAINNIQSLNSIIDTWIPNCNNEYNDKKPYYILIGNKFDQTYDNGILHKIKEITVKLDIDYIEISAKTLYNIDVLFENILNNYKKNNKYILIDNLQNVNISNEQSILLNTSDEYNIIDENCCIIN